MVDQFNPTVDRPRRTQAPGSRDRTPHNFLKDETHGEEGSSEEASS